MDVAFWLGIICGAMVGIPFSIIANLWTDPVRGYLDQRRNIALSRERDQELLDYKIALALHDGIPLALVDFSLRRDASQRAMLLSLMCLIIAATASCFAISSNDPKPYLVLAVPLCLAAIWLSARSTASIRRSTDLMLKGMALEEYEQKIRAKWGDNALD